MHRSLSRLSKRIRPSVKTAEVRRMKMQNFRKKTIIFLIVWPLVALFGVPMFLWTGYVQARSRESYSKAADAHAVRFNLRMEFNQYGHIVFILVVLYLNYNEFPLVKKFLSTFGGFIRLVYGRK
uniref:Uncharacterized protein n=2 Tax=Amorphochlora amoebiformis TaxID=1561963 RepID=A0A7S0CV67_9EUKA|mmetsp:Transcript_13899/g.21988  ORF Transcript_13899/g.21988 Transcript_13899/m.21988 type:complete len:124 (+) Transcript_13899:57-428(+)